MGRITRNEEIVRKVEALALDMLKKGSERDTNIDLKMDIFEKVTKWVAVKNKLEGDDAGGIADYKRRLHGESETDKHYSPSRRPRGKSEPVGGPRLEAIKSRLPRADGGDDDGDSGDTGGEVPAAGSGNGSLRAGLHGDGEPGAIPAGGDDHL